ncbi:DUF551 domain-containing protein [Verrucomicrobium spinosum]|uniref:DUF551 domain-containing protein n=1 Tax=Verrucomicrobium spinosum TaxID=2736 RepID=UPI0001745C09|nr:DUF551 domain-containing protein [Verrucomicrobium spinosum]
MPLTLTWIPVSESVPDDNTSVLGTSPLWDSEPVWPCYLEEGDWYSVDGSLLSSPDLLAGTPPTHWMHFPEPPTA